MTQWPVQKTNNKHSKEHAKQKDVRGIKNVFEEEE